MKRWTQIAKLLSVATILTPIPGGCQELVMQTLGIWWIVTA